jgi:hypothetical protein
VHASPNTVIRVIKDEMDMACIMCEVDKMCPEFCFENVKEVHLD